MCAMLSPWAPSDPELHQSKGLKLIVMDQNQSSPGCESSWDSGQLMLVTLHNTILTPCSRQHCTLAEYSSMLLTSSSDVL